MFTFFLCHNHLVKLIRYKLCHFHIFNQSCFVWRRLINRNITNMFSHWWQDYPMMSFLIIYQAQLHEGFSIPLPGTVLSSYGWSISFSFLNQIFNQPSWTSGGGVIPRITSLRWGNSRQIDSCWCNIGLRRSCPEEYLCWNIAWDKLANEMEEQISL